MQLLLRFRMGCDGMPCSWSKPKEARLETVCRLYATGTISDEKHLLSEGPGLQENRGKWASLFSEPDSVHEFMLQDDLVRVAVFINKCLEKALVPAAVPSHDGQAFDQPEIAGKEYNLMMMMMMIKAYKVIGVVQRVIG